MSTRMTDLVCVGEAVDDLLKRNSDVRNLLVVGHVDGLEDPRVKNPIGGVGDARGGRVAMTEDDTDAPTTLDGRVRVPHAQGRADT